MFDKRCLKKAGEELQRYMIFQRRHSAIPPKKGKGSFKRKQKHKREDECL